MNHEIYVSREIPNLGHNNAARLIKQAAIRALEAEKVNVNCIISVMLTDDAGIRRVNRDFRGIDRETDVLSFPLNELERGAFDPALCEREPESGAVLLGDMMISLPRCEEQGADFGHGFDREIQYLTVHSVLHLLGYDHVDEGPMKAQMRAREKEILGDE